MKSIEKKKIECTTLPQFPYPIFFVCKNKKVWADIFEVKHPPRVEELYPRFLDGRDVWIVQTYIQLKQLNLNVHLVSKFIPGEICIASNDDLSIRDANFNSFVVACRHDRGRPEICEQRIVQNKLCIVDHTDYYIPHWPQPKLLPREQLRGGKIENIVFKGLSACLSEKFKNQQFVEKLRSIGVELHISKADLDARFGDWTDYRKADLVLAVRDCNDYILSIKPPTKLINSWFAGCPALLGPEPAYRQLRLSELDYIEICEPNEVMRVVNALRDNPNLYHAMIKNGSLRAVDFTSDKITLKWYELLAGSVTENYKIWMKKSAMCKFFGRPMQHAYRGIYHERAKRVFFQNINYARNSSKKLEP